MYPSTQVPHVRHVRHGTLQELLSNRRLSIATGSYSQSQRQVTSSATHGSKIHLRLRRGGEQDAEQKKKIQWGRGN